MAEAIAEGAPGEAEILVIDNDSTDATATRVTEWIARYDGEARCVSQQQGGLSASRNKAIREARGALLLFTDDDCRLDRYYVRDALRYDEVDTAPVLRGGRVELGDPADLPLTIITEAHKQRWQVQDNAARRHDLGNTILGCNMAMRQSLAQSIQGFDELFGGGSRIPSAEDTDFIFRAYLAGYAIEYVPDMVVQHFHGRKTPSQGRQLLMGYALGKGALYTKFALRAPNLCRQFYWDFKDMIREWFSAGPGKFESVGFRYTDQITYNLEGAMLYVSVRLERLWRKPD